MDRKIPTQCSFHYTVGDPVDVTSGANTDITLDFQLTGPIPLKWNRYYNSAQYDVLSSLGWGHTHEYSRFLYFDAEGIHYINPAGETVTFPYLLNDGDEAKSDGLTLERGSPGFYLIYGEHSWVMEFEIDNLELPTPLSRLRWGPFSIEFRYGKNRRLEDIIDSSGRPIRVDYNDRNLISGLFLIEPQKNRDRRLVTYRYDDTGNLIEGMDPYGHAFSFKYDESNRMISRTDRRGYSFYFEYDQSGQCIHSYGEDGLHQVRLEYLPSETSTIVTEADGGKWTYQYNENGTVLKIIDPYDGEQRFIVDEQDRVIEEIDPNGNIINWIYNEDGALIGKEDNFNNPYPIDNQSNEDRTERRNQPKTPIEWELGGSWAFSSYRLPPSQSPVLTQLASPIAKLVRIARSDRSDDKITKPGLTPVGPPEFPGKTKYDIFGTLISCTDVDGATQSWRYDPNGNIIRYIDAEGSEWHSDYTSWNLLVSTVDPLKHAISYDYTRSEKLARVFDAGGTTSDFAYDLKDRKISIARHGADKDLFRYDKADNLIETLDSNGKTLCSIEIGFGNLPKTIRFPSGHTRTLKYDKRGRLVHAMSIGLDQRMEFDDIDNQLLDERNGVGIRNEFRGLNLAEATVFDRFKIEYGKDENEGYFVIDPTGRKHFLKYLGHGLFLRSLSNSAKELCQYDWAGRCLMKVAYDPSAPQRNWARQYWYSPVGNLTRAEDSTTGSLTYRYDPAHRLAHEVDRSGRERAYSYDGAGNLLEAPGLSGVRVSENRLLTANGCRFEYNNRNHVAKRIEPSGTTKYEYDEEDRLIRCTTPEGVWTARYDALGRRTSKTWKGRTTKYYWDRERLIAEIFSDGRVRIYVYSDGRARVPFMFVEYNDLNADQASGQQYFIYTNQIGCPVKVEAASRQVVWSARISPYGKADIDPQSSIDFCLIFPGHYLDAEIGLHYNFHRYYSPELGRYIQSDPIDIDGGINVYAYTPRPLTEVDLDGLSCPRQDIILDPADRANFNRAKAQAIRLGNELRQLMRDTPARITADGTIIPLSRNMTASVLTVRRNGRWVNVVSSNNPNAFRRAPVLRNHLRRRGVEFVSPERQRPRDAERHPTVRTNSRGESRNQHQDTRHHAERQGLRWADETPDVEGVGFIYPTNRCCGGCQADIRNRGDQTLASVPGDRIDSNSSVIPTEPR